MAYPSYGFSVLTPDAPDAQDLAARHAEECAYKAFVAGDACQSKGPNASVYLAEVPRQHQAFARTYFKALSGKGVAAGTLDEQTVSTAQASRQDALTQRNY